MIDGAEILAQIHAGREGFARAGEDDAADGFVDFQRVQNLDHVVVEPGAHGVALLGTIHRHPSDAFVELDQNVLPVTDALQRRRSLLLVGHVVPVPVDGCP